MKKIQSNCLGCTRREVGCHSKCEDYKEFQEKNRERREADYRARKLTNTINDMNSRSKSTKSNIKLRREK